MIALKPIPREKVRVYAKTASKLSSFVIYEDLKLYGKCESQIRFLADTVYTFSADNRMEFGLKKCGVLDLKSYRGAGRRDGL